MPWITDPAAIARASELDPSDPLAREGHLVVHLTNPGSEVDAALRSVAQQLGRPTMASSCRGELRESAIKEWNRALDPSEVRRFLAEVEPLLLKEIMSWQRRGKVCNFTIILPNLLDSRSLILCQCPGSLGAFYPDVDVEDGRPVGISLSLSPGSTTIHEDQFRAMKGRTRLTVRLRRNSEGPQTGRGDSTGPRSGQ